MTKPIQQFKHKGIQLAYWGNGKFSLQKRYKKKDSEEWVNTNSYFKNELEELGKLIQQAVAFEEPANSQPLAELPKSEALPFDDDDIPF